MTDMNPWVIPALAFVAAAGLVGALAAALTGGRRRIGKRLRNLEASRSARQPRDADRFPAITALLERKHRDSAIADALERAGIPWRPSEFVVACAAGVAGLAALGWVLLGPLGAAGGIVAAVAVPALLIKALQARRLRQFERQLPDALMLVASSLRSGYGILRAMQAVRDEMAPPISLEFGRTLDETNVGVPTAETLAHLAQRVPLQDLDIAVTAILIQLETGGNLAEVMEIVASTVRERQRIRAEVNTLTAEGRMSGVILFILPLVLAVVLGALNPAYMASLFTSGLGHLLIILALALQALGGLWIYRMLQIDF